MRMEGKDEDADDGDHDPGAESDEDVARRGTEPAAQQWLWWGCAQAFERVCHLIAATISFHGQSLFQDLRAAASHLLTGDPKHRRLEAHNPVVQQLRAPPHENSNGTCRRSVRLPFVSGFSFADQAD